LQQAANDGLGCTFDDFGDFAFGATFAVVPHDAHFDAVAVQHSAHLVRRQVQVSTAIVALHKSVSVAVAKSRAFNFF
jgi:hypothetical protein